jgi:hypothetical protein
MAVKGLNCRKQKLRLALDMHLKIQAKSLQMYYVNTNEITALNPHFKIQVTILKK